MKHLSSNLLGRTLDESTRRLFSLDTSILVEKASLRLWDALKTEVLWSKGREIRIVALCGKGGNGDDALAMLRHAFSAGYGNIAAIVASDKASNPGSRQVVSLRSAGVEVHAWGSLGQVEAAKLLSKADLVLDGILGTGASGSPRGEAADMIQALSFLSGVVKRPMIIAVDIPSGLHEAWSEGEACVAADLTLALEPLKTAHFLPNSRKVCGRIKAVSDVFPMTLLKDRSGPELLEETDLGALQPALVPAAYKMRRGRLAIFAGSKGGAGAARLCAKAAAASGAGYVTLYVDEELLPSMAQDLESMVVRPLEAWSGEGLDCDALLVGPGWGRGKGRKAILETLAGKGIPLVLDADAIRLVAEEPGILGDSEKAVILTPHPGEFEALADPSGKGCGEPFLVCLEEVGKRYKSLVIYKSHVTWIRGPGGHLAVWDGMIPELGTAGSGDVLAGLLAGLAASAIAQSAGQRGSSEAGADASALFDAARCAVIVHGMAGRSLGREKGWFEASDLVPVCAKILHDSRRSAYVEA